MTMQAKLSLIENVHFQAQADSGHTVAIDGPPEGGGENRGSRPMELVLMGLAGCAAYDVVSILRKSRQKIDGCVTHVSAERAEAVPQVFTTIHLHFVLSGENLDPKKVARAIELSADKYCSASRMLAAGGVAITHDFVIES